jgi:hypothetical protein
MDRIEVQASDHPDRIVDKHDPRVLVGWTHRDTPSGIDLRLQSTRSRIALENGQVESSHLLMTRNQALLLARYLLDVTGQTLPDAGQSRRRSLSRFLRLG